MTQEAFGTLDILLKYEYPTSHLETLQPTIGSSSLSWIPKYPQFIFFIHYDPFCPKDKRVFSNLQSAHIRYVTTCNLYFEYISIIL